MFGVTSPNPVILGDPSEKSDRMIESAQQQPYRSLEGSQGTLCDFIDISFPQSLDQHGLSILFGEVEAP